MPTIEQFFEEINELFGFYYDNGLANFLALEKIEEIQNKSGATDESPFMYKSGPPTNTPDIEAKNANHNTTLGRVKDRIKKNGFNQQKTAEATIIIIYHIWEEKYRDKLLNLDGSINPKNTSDIFGDIRLVRNSIIHNKGIADKEITKCKVFKKFHEGQKIELIDSDINFILDEVKKDFKII